MDSSEMHRNLTRRLPSLDDIGLALMVFVVIAIPVVFIAVAIKTLFF